MHSNALFLSGTDQEAAAAPARLSAQVDIKGERVRRQQRAAGLRQVPREHVEHDGLLKKEGSVLCKRFPGRQKNPYECGWENLTGE